MNVIIFYILAAVILVCSVLTVTSRKILRAATALMFTLIATAGLYFLLQVNFLAAVQLMIYAGGIVVLIVFSILLTHHMEHQFDLAEPKKAIPAALAAIAGTVICISTVLQFDFTSRLAEQTTAPDVKLFGRAFLNYGEGGYVLPFEVISILLLAAMVAAIMIAKKNKQ
ncbi:MAG: NADH-quinone oxidoreductase subunit J [Bacteroidales bacterium]|jgi:NADH-quinone oxidoreductase subunit J|nr:NADH-quinone oxidoreductase subunit J [Bacteroidales bacterium]